MSIPIHPESQYQYSFSMWIQGDISQSFLNKMFYQLIINFVNTFKSTMNITKKLYLSTSFYQSFPIHSITFQWCKRFTENGFSSKEISYIAICLKLSLIVRFKWAIRLVLFIQPRNMHKAMAPGICTDVTLFKLGLRCGLLENFKSFHHGIYDLKLKVMMFCESQISRAPLSQI